jgi:hypothetical protein
MNKNTRVTTSASPVEEGKDDAVMVDSSALLEDDDDVPAIMKQYSSENVTLIDGSLTYANIITQDVDDDDDNISLHTTFSQESIDISMSLAKKEQKQHLSFHASQVDSAELTQLEVMTANATSTTMDDAALESVPSSLEGHNLEVLVNVGNQLLKEEEEPTTRDEEKKKSGGASVKLLVVVAALVAIMVMGMPFAANRPMEEVVSVQQPVEPIVTLLSYNNVTTDLEDEPALEEFVPAHEELFDEEETSQTSWTIGVNDALNILLMAFAACLSTLKPRQGEIVPSAQSQVICTEDETTTAEEPQLVKEEAAVKPSETNGWDLSSYETLKVVQLRELLRSRKFKTVGRKPVLIQRLANIYKAELDTLTVRQLRPILKSKGFKQAGKKSELIQKLVEAGM